MIVFQNVNKIYGQTYALKDISLEIDSGEFVCVIGTSGSGKTTLTRMINRMNEPSSGTILIDGQNIQSLNEVELRRKIGYVIQNIGLFPHMTIRENIMLVPKLLKWTTEQKSGIAKSLIEKVELPIDSLERRPDSLSGGQQQRVGVIRALAANQNIILMDEPFGALDPITRAALQDLIKKIHKEMQQTVIFVTHDMDEALKLADRILIMDKGKVVQFDKATVILSHPANDFVKTLLGNNKTNSLYDNQKKVKEIMNPDVKSIPSDKSIIEAIKSMRDNKVDSLMVVNDQNAVRGYISFKDIDQNILRATTVEEIMHEDNSRVNENEELKDIIFPLLEGEFEYLPVVDNDNHLVGIVTRGLLAELVYEQFE